MIEKGVRYNFKPISEEQHKKDLYDAIKRGNYKSAQLKAELLESLVQNNISTDFQLLILASLVVNIPNVVVVPYRIINQFTINELGECIPKDRLIYD